MLQEEEALSLQYAVPTDGLTLSVSVTDGGANLYGSSSDRNPTFITADFAVGGSGSFSHHYVPQQEGETLYVTLIGTTPSTNFTLTATDGNNNANTAAGKI